MHVKSKYININWYLTKIHHKVISFVREPTKNVYLTL
jgi:hypothetical protein